MGSIIISVGVVAIGVALGLARGGSISAVRSVRPKWWPLLVGGGLLHAFAENVEIWGATSWAVIGMFAMIVGLVANASFRGALIAAFGLTLNLIVLVINGAVPIRFEALSAAGIIGESTERSQITSVGHLFELESATTTLAFLGDVIPIGILDSVISIGDLVTFAGVIVIVSNVIAARRRSGLDVDDVFAPIALEDEAPLMASSEGERLSDLVGIPVDDGVLDLATPDGPVIDVTAQPLPIEAADTSAADTSVADEIVLAEPAEAAFDPDDLWADDDTGVRILGPSSKLSQ